MPVESDEKAVNYSTLAPGGSQHDPDKAAPAHSASKCLPHAALLGEFRMHITQDVPLFHRGAVADDAAPRGGRRGGCGTRSIDEGPERRRGENGAGEEVVEGKRLLKNVAVAARREGGGESR